MAQQPGKEKLFDSADDSIKNPGNFEQISQEPRSLFELDAFDGLRLDMVRSLTPRFMATANCLLGSVMIPGGSMCRLGVNAAPTDNNLVMLSADKTGRQDYRWHFNHKQFSSKVNVQLGEQKMFSAEVERKGKTHTMGWKMMNDKMMSMHYLQALTPKLVLGADYIWNRAENKSVMSLQGKYGTPMYYTIFSFLPTQQMLQSSVVRKLNERVTMGAQMTYVHPQGTANANLGVQFNFKHAKLSCSVDSDGKLNSVLMDQLMPGLTGMFSATLDHAEQGCKFGFGIQFGQ